jgi:anthranilate/para-aminobenzoate synthase component II
MEWREQEDGRLEKQVDGMSLVLDPFRLSLQVAVTDCHAKPIDVDLAELQRIVARPVPQPAQPTPAGQRRQVPRPARTHWRLLLVGVCLGVAVLGACALGRGCQTGQGE